MTFWYDVTGTPWSRRLGCIGQADGPGTATIYMVISRFPRGVAKSAGRYRRRGVRRRTAMSAARACMGIPAGTHMLSHGYDTVDQQLR